MPKKIVRPAEYAYEKFKPFDVDRIVGNTGALQKREAAPGQTASDLCIAAAKPLIEALGWDPKTIDAVILYPVQTATNLLAYETGYFDARQVLRFGLAMLLLTLIATLTLVVPYWTLLGVSLTSQ